jgi:hypothetical protein
MAAGRLQPIPAVPRGDSMKRPATGTSSWLIAQPVT